MALAKKHMSVGVSSEEKEGHGCQKQMVNIALSPKDITNEVRATSVKQR